MTTKASLTDLAIAAGCAVLGGLWIIKILPSVWRGTGPVANLFQYDSSSKQRVWGRALWHAHVPAIPFGTTLFFVLIGFLLVDYLAPANITFMIQSSKGWMSLR